MAALPQARRSPFGVVRQRVHHTSATQSMRMTLATSLSPSVRLVQLAGLLYDLESNVQERCISLHLVQAQAEASSAWLGR